jgi:hypothetical protein
MKIPLIPFVRSHPVATLLVAGALLGAYALLRPHSNADDRMPVSITGVQHLGSDYLINVFYVNGYNGSNVGESGGGGRVCCVTLPQKWLPGLKAEVRWEVHHIIRSSDRTAPETAEIVGIYHAQVPVEAYANPSRFWVHFFPQGRVRIVVSPISSRSVEHPIQWADAQASQTATVGMVVKALFTNQEIAESEREASRDRAKYGDWR